MIHVELISANVKINVVSLFDLSLFLVAEHLISTQPPRKLQWLAPLGLVTKYTAIVTRSIRIGH